MEEITTVGIDLAKEVFAVCMLDARGSVVERKVLRRLAFERSAAGLALAGSARARIWNPSSQMVA